MMVMDLTLPVDKPYFSAGDSLLNLISSNFLVFDFIIIYSDLDL